MQYECRHSRDRLSFNVDVCEVTCIKRIQEFDDREFKSFMQLQSTPVPMLHGPYPLLAMVEAQCGNCMEVKGLDYLWNSTCSMSLQATNVCGPESWATNRELGMELAGRDDNNDEKMATVYAMLLKGTSVTLPFQQNLPGDNGILDLNEGLSGINVSIRFVPLFLFIFFTQYKLDALNSQFCRYKQSFGSVAEASCSHESYRCITICIQKNGKKNPSPSSFTCRWEMLRNFIARLKKEQEGKAL
jgi:hypothetical protein